MKLIGGDGIETLLPPMIVLEQAIYGTRFMPDTKQHI